ncbi:MAG: PAS domain-containing sensor histidine kinase [Bdellovibrionota bacterium]
MTSDKSAISSANQDTNRHNAMGTSAVSENDRFKLLVESILDYAIFMLDIHGKIATWNEGARRFKGYEANEIIGKHFSVFYPEEDKAAKKPEMELEIAQRDGRFEEEGLRLRKDGTNFWANVVITAIRDSKGELKGYSKVTRDISDKKQAEDKLRQSEERYRLMIEAVKDYAIFMLDPKGYITTWNEGARRFKGYEAKEIIGKHFSTFYTEPDIIADIPGYELIEATANGRIEMEGWRLRKDGTQFWANVVITRVNDGTGNLIGFTKVTRDLTERKIAQEKLQEVNEALEQSKVNLEKRVEERTEELQKAVRARDEFVSVASHELKTPLTALRLQAQITQRNINRGDFSIFTKERVTQFANQLDTQVDRLSHLVEDMLDISRIQVGKLTTSFEKTNLSNLVQGVVDRFQVQVAAANCEVEMDLQPDVEGNWDQFRLEQVVLNLLSNATKYGAGKKIKIELLKENDRAVLSVADHGMGISKEDQERIFERFERAISPNEVSGLGLGLYIAKEIVIAHEGTIEVESDIGKGSKFTVEIALNPKQPTQHKRSQDYEF